MATVFHDALRIVKAWLSEANMDLNPDLNPNLLYSVLPAVLIVRGFVAGDEKCNYELYLTEMLNESKWFRNRFPKGFIWQESQSNGECDARSGKYGLDFKLIASKTKMQARSMLSPQIYTENGWTVYCGSRLENTKIQATRLFAALREYNLPSLEELRRRQIKPQGIENDISAFLKTLETKKHLMLFQPGRFSFNASCERTAGAQIIGEALYHDFAQSLIFRKKHTGRFDTFLVTIYEDAFLLFKFNHVGLKLIDSVPTSRCETFAHLESYSEFD